MSEKFAIERDTFGRWRTAFSPTVACGIRLLAEDHPRRVAKNVRAYVVLDIASDLMLPIVEDPEEEGEPQPLPVTFRIRDIEIVHHAESDRFLVRYRQWKTGKVRDGQDEYLDVAGPANRESRYFLQDQILAFFNQIREEASQGTLGRRRPVTSDALGNHPVVRQHLQDLAKQLDQAEKQVQPEPGTNEEEALEGEGASA